MNDRSTALPILIAGAGIAGPALAFWLNRAGLKSVVVERSDGIRMAGQQVDLKGPGTVIARVMGMEETIKQKTVPEKGVTIEDDDRIEWARFASNPDAPILTEEIEILRSDLSQLLYDETRPYTEYIFGDYIDHMEETADRVTVHFHSGTTRDFLLVVGADGIGSRTRRMTFGWNDPSYRSLNQYLFYFTVPGYEFAEDYWGTIHHATNGRVSLARLDGKGNTRMCLSIRPSDPSEIDNWSKEEDQRALMRRLFGDIRWLLPTVIEKSKDSTDFYSDQVAQIKMDKWSNGRVVLLGDAAWAPSSGTGTSLDLLGAYVLAGELSSHTDHTIAFESYEQKMRPYIEPAQNLVGTILPDLFSPKSWAGVMMFRYITYASDKSGLAYLIVKLIGLGYRDKKEVTIPEVYFQLLPPNERLKE